MPQPAMIPAATNTVPSTSFGCLMPAPPSSTTAAATSHRPYATGCAVARSPAGQMQLHALVRCDEPERFVEALRVGTRLVRRQLHEVAATAPRAPDRVLDHRPAEPRRA